MRFTTNPLPLMEVEMICDNAKILARQPFKSVDCTDTPKSGMFDYSKVDEIVSIIVREFNPQKIVIFGSVARHEATDDSDLDMLIVMDTDAPYLSRSYPIRRLLYENDIPLDLMVLTPDEFESRSKKESGLVHHIVSTGVVAYAS